jgi:hypothetical protein
VKSEHFPRLPRIDGHAVENNSQICFSAVAGLNAGGTGPPLQFKTESVMKTFARLALIAVFALCSAVAFAGDSQSINLSVHEDTTIAGVKVPAGEYKMVIDRQGPVVKFTLMRGGRIIVATDAHFAELASFSAPTAVVTGANAKVTEIQVSKLKGAIVFDVFDQGTASAGGK